MGQTYGSLSESRSVCRRTRPKKSAAGAPLKIADIKASRKGEKTALFVHFFDQKKFILPRQTQDKHRENSRKCRVLAVRRVDKAKGDALQKVRGRKTSFWSHFDT